MRTASPRRGPAAPAYPVWLIVLSYRLPGHLADQAGEDVLRAAGVIASAAEPLEVA